MHAYFCIIVFEKHAFIFGINFLPYPTQKPSLAPKTPLKQLRTMAATNEFDQYR